MKIGLVSPYDYSFPGGVVNHIAYLAHNFIQLGHKVKIIAPCPIRGTRYFEEEVTPVGKPLPIPYAGSIARVPVSPWLPAQIGEILAKEEFDILHLHEPFAPMICLSALLKSTSINVGTFHACHTKPRTYWLGKPIFRRWLSKLHGKIAVSKPALEYVSRHLPGDYRIIPNGIDTEHFRFGGHIREEFADDKTNILFVGRLERRKGLAYLLNACARVKASFPNLRLIVVGPGTILRSRYEKMVEDMNLTNNVVFTGFVPSIELPSYYRSADIFCAPATGGESFGIVLLEAMACGKPVIATNIQGYASVLAHGDEGLLVPPKDIDSLAQALLSLLNDKSLRLKMGEKGKIKAEKYSWPNLARQITDYYNSLLGSCA
ncbi:MAG: glycosyltransferase family 4 protein [Dehalococcoidia bacterium]|nr:glycosyltransferase family 4 protein [Dehalococcoidia bacterium]